MWTTGSSCLESCWVTDLIWNWVQQLCPFTFSLLVPLNLWWTRLATIFLHQRWRVVCLFVIVCPCIEEFKLCFFRGAVTSSLDEVQTWLSFLQAQKITKTIEKGHNWRDSGLSTFNMRINPCHLWRKTPETRVESNLVVSSWSHLIYSFLDSKNGGFSWSGRTLTCEAAAPAAASSGKGDGPGMDRESTGSHEFTSQINGKYIYTYITCHIFILYICIYIYICIYVCVCISSTRIPASFPLNQYEAILRRDGLEMESSKLKGLLY